MTAQQKVLLYYKLVVWSGLARRLYAGQHEKIPNTFRVWMDILGTYILALY